MSFPPGAEFREVIVENENAGSRRGAPSTEGTINHDGLLRLAPPAARTTEEDGGRRRATSYTRTANQGGSRRVHSPSTQGFQHDGSSRRAPRSPRDLRSSRAPQLPRTPPGTPSASRTAQHDDSMREDPHSPRAAPRIFELTWTGAQYDEAERLIENNGPRREAPTTGRSARTFVDGLPSTSFEKIQLGDDSVVCSVCLEVMVSGGLVKRLPCLHSYHKDCIMYWVDSHSTCPLCRFELPRDNLQHGG